MSRHNARNRTALFDQPQRVQSPYENPPRRDYSAADIARMEEQSEDEQKNMFFKVGALKRLSLKMGEEINGSNETLSQLDQTFGKVETNIKRAMTYMQVVAQKTGVPLKHWALLFAALALLFFYVWIT